MLSVGLSILKHTHHYHHKTTSGFHVCIVDGSPRKIKHKMLRNAKTLPNTAALPVACFGRGEEPLPTSSALFGCLGINRIHN